LLPGGGQFWLVGASGYRASEVRSGQTGARSFCRALLPRFAGLGCLGFLVAKQALPKCGRRLGAGGRPGSVTVRPSRLGPEGSRGEGGGRVALPRADGPGGPRQLFTAAFPKLVRGRRPVFLPQRRRVAPGRGLAGGGRRRHRRPRCCISAPLLDGLRFDGRRAGARGGGRRYGQIRRGQRGARGRRCWAAGRGRGGLNGCRRGLLRRDLIRPPGGGRRL
jgi:hypothetical protein